MTTKEKKEYFKQKLIGVDKMIADYEFSRYKTGHVREQIRIEYDQAKSRLSVVDAQLASENETNQMPEEEKAKLIKHKETLEKELKAQEAQMEKCDNEVNGTTEIIGVNQYLDSMHELKIILNNYIKTIK